MGNEKYRSVADFREKLGPKFIITNAGEGYVAQEQTRRQDVKET